MKLNTPRVVIAGVASGVGKTTVTVGLIGALKARGMKVAAFKCGPDYLDPTYHAQVAGASHNLDGWMMGRQAVLATFGRVAKDADFAIIEGVMGLFDGASPVSDQGSTAEIAKWLKAPVVVVVDASGMARTIAALAKGFASFDHELRVVGIVANRLGSRGHLELLRASQPVVPVVGGLPKDRDHAFPERHLGLFSANVNNLPQQLFSTWAALVKDWIDVDAIVAAGQDAEPLELDFDPNLSAPSRTRCKIALAFDEAFHFYYEDNLRRLEQAGAELVRFSPLHDRTLPDDVDGLYLGGGYPETVADALAANASMLESIRRFARDGAPVYAECGGLMYLCHAIRTLDGKSHPMLGLIDGEAVMADRIQALGYAEVETVRETILGPAGLRFRGHQFRYSSLSSSNSRQDACAYLVSTRRKSAPFREGYVVGNVLASYVHAHFASNPSLAEGFVASCEAYRLRRTSFWHKDTSSCQQHLKHTERN